MIQLSQKAVGRFLAKRESRLPQQQFLNPLLGGPKNFFSS
jgi:hypothetical protein